MSRIFMPYPICQGCHEEPANHFVSWEECPTASLGEGRRMGLGMCQNCVEDRVTLLREQGKKEIEVDGEQRLG